MLGFVAAALVVLLIPGPGVLYIVARSLGQGQRAGLVSVLGLSAGALVHVAAQYTARECRRMTADRRHVQNIAGQSYHVY